VPGRKTLFFSRFAGIESSRNRNHEVSQGKVGYSIYKMLEEQEIEIWSADKFDLQVQAGDLNMRKVYCKCSSSGCFHNASGHACSETQVIEEGEACVLPPVR
jgi:hypothetical protein